VVVLDPFMGAGTTAVVAKKLTRNYIGCEINPEYIEMAERGIAEINPLFE
jgi:DNA modification methylase